MKRWIRVSTMLVAMLVLIGQPAMTQTSPQVQSGQAMVSIYHVAPGQHINFLKWQAAREAVNQSLGFPPASWYAHLDGDSWDYIAVAPKLTEEQETQLEREAGNRGLTTGFAAGIELRHFMLSHTDTIAVGPISARGGLGQAPFVDRRSRSALAWSTGRLGEEKCLSNVVSGYSR